MNKTTMNDLEKILCECGLHATVSSLAEIAFERGENTKTSTQGKAISNEWLKAAKLLNACAEKINKIGVHS